MFQLAKDDQTWPCEITVPVPGEKGPVPHKCTVRFRLIPASEFDRIAYNDGAVAEAVLVGWDDIQDADGEPLPYNDETKRQLLDVSYFRRAVGLAYVRWSSGLSEGNSAALSAIS